MESIKKEPKGNYSKILKENPVIDCPLTAAIMVIGGKWKLIIIYWLEKSPQHFAGLKKLIPGISQKVLTQQLLELISAGIIERKSTGKIPNPVFYYLTEYGKTLTPIVQSIKFWGEKHLTILNG
ncbi:MAG: helix-turn-helix transcriptional regulator [Marinilabiliales bacterium]|nr:helix-turn-helix transcriptional regulator [Marinilabiliales bacterium]